MTAIFAVAAFEIAVLRAADLAESIRAAENLAQVLAEQTSRTIQPIDMTLREVQALLENGAPEHQGTPDDEHAHTIYNLFVERMKGLAQVDGFMVIGTDGHVVATSREYPAVQIDVSKRDFFEYLSVHDDHGLFVGQLIKTYRTNRWTVFLARRINDAHGGFSGVVLAAVTLSYLEDFYRAVAPPNDAISLLRRDGVLLVRHPAGPAPASNEMPPPAWFTSVEAGGGSYRSTTDLVAVRPLRDFSLVIDVGTTQSAALAAWAGQALRLLGAAFLVVAGVVSLLWMFAKQFKRLAGQNVQLETGRQQFDAVLENMSQGLTFFDATERLMICNRRFAEIYRLSADQVRPGIMLAEIVRHNLANGSFPDMTMSDYLARRRGFASLAKSFEITDEFRDGRVISMHYQPLPNGGWVTTHEEVTERRRNEAALVFMARHDALTKLPNRIFFLERMAVAIAETQRGGHCALLCLDLDRFKSINDTLGHPIGDGLLRAVALRLTGIVREGDTVARLGGDEFAIVLAGLKSPEHAASLAERIIVAFTEPYEIEGHRIIVGTSVGVSIAPRDGMLPDTLAKNADIALYLAKADGRGTYRFFEPEIDSYIQRRRAIEHDLRAAVPEEDFVLHYQPILDLGTGGVIGFEALIRWRHPTRGLLDPPDFLSVAEETGLIVPIGAWVLRQACQEAAGWPDDIEISVNLSPVQLKRGKILGLVQDALTASGLAPERLELEITEASLQENIDDRLAILRQLRGFGVRIALDDFGAGLASLSHLRRFPFSNIKVHPSLISELLPGSASAGVFGAIVALARSLGMTTTAEGVETAQQLSVVRDQGCMTAQGYLFGRPQPASEALGVIRHLRVPGSASALEVLRESFDQASVEPVVGGADLVPV